MKGIVLAGGTGSRLFPLTKVTNKHLLPIGHEPMIYYPIKKILEAGISEILIVTGVEHMGAVVNLLGSGKDFNCRFTYKVQDEAGGIAQALGLAENFAGDDNVLVILGDNIFSGNLKQAAADFKNGATIFLQQVEDPQRFGVAIIENNNVVKIEEKPKNPKSNYAVTGLYIYDKQVFEYIKNLKRSQRGELEITDVNNAYLIAGNLHYQILDGFWTDAGTFESLYHANALVHKQNS
ncbi:MAG: sugar phosphate nucleotidyltransferase [Candidatus Margulisbacteria bacterium]|nr:sugar phosphate nucleotidyltransferase [Candidatus Margulisiibacteriota bacterium]